MCEYDKQRNYSLLGDLATLQILSRLPVKSLARFRCVCSSWFSLLNDPCFVSMHLNNHTRCPTRAFSHILFNFSFDLSFYFLGFDNDNDNGNHNRLRLRPRLDEDEVTMSTSLVNFDLSSFLDMEVFGSPLVAGSRDGLVCLWGAFEVDKIALWNPTIRDFKILSASGLARPPPPARFQSSCVGFGFDPKADDFKVVQILVYQVHPYDLVWHTQVEVYSLSTDSWTELDVIVPADLLPKPNIIACENNLNNGIIYWRDWNVILSLHLSDQVFHAIPLPPGAEGSIVDFEDCFPLMFWKNTGQWDFEVWATNEYGAGASWTRLFRIGLEPYPTVPHGFWSKHGELLMHNGLGQLTIYDPANGESTPIIQLDESASTLGISIYKESLLSVTNKSRQ